MRASTEEFKKTNKSCKTINKNMESYNRDYYANKLFKSRGQDNRKYFRSTYSENKEKSPNTNPPFLRFRESQTPALGKK